ncbi:MAG: hypothetical protein B6D62_00495 [Candidatus Cloacimonas sp. 4484_275]|jgi:3-methyladenine DNA glycosylase AlkC|nr:MAG: hypothetical protein B6D62_00495 [Candidatus Cloacimonas sp. 4484_275]RLC50637.1 MAG: hypothetical protein DRZ79_04090 [Candidatus Cloacimonadota bacterium]
MMLNEIGRLDAESVKELNKILDSIYKLLDENKKDKAEKKLIQLAKTPNFFIREYVGKHLVKYKDQRKIIPIAKRMIKHKIYGVRATALFYFYERYQEDVEKIFKFLDETFDKTPWEVETIINELWKNYPDYMKKKMVEWLNSNNHKKRALSFHGMENIAQSDPDFIMKFISKAIDDDTLEVQKKITHILTQVARANPIIAFPYIKEWLTDADETRTKTIWVSMKKLANIVNQKYRRDNGEDFVMLTEQTINDWRNDENETVSNMGERLARIIRI